MPSSEPENELKKSEDMSLSDVLPSEPELSPNVPRVLDYLYHDARRIGSFLAQFHDLGLVQEIRQTDAVGQSEVSKTNVSGGVRAFVHGQAGNEQSVAAEEKEASERKYDPFWKSAGAMLDLLDEHKLVQNDIWQTRLGQIVKISGGFIVFDGSTIKKLWSNEKLKDMIISNMTSSLPTAAAVDEFKVNIEFLSILPSSGFSHFLGDNFSA